MKGLYCRTGGSDFEPKFIIKETVSLFFYLFIYIRASRPSDIHLEKDINPTEINGENRMYVCCCCHCAAINVQFVELVCR